MDKLRIYVYYILIAAISVIALSVIPMLQSTIDASFNFPKTKSAWILWIGSRISVTVLNMLIFHCFICQADLNTREDERRKAAEDIIASIIEKEVKKDIPISKDQFLKNEYRRKIPTIAISTICSLIAFAPAVLAFDVTTFLTYSFTIIIAIIFGVIEMLKVETYYKTEYLSYAKFLKEEKECLQSYYSPLSQRSPIVVTECAYLGKNKESNSGIRVNQVKGEKNVKI